MLIRKSFGVIVILLIGLLAACGSDSETGTDLSSSGGSDGVFELNINNWASSTHHYVYNVYEPWKELVEEKTNGRVKVNIYHGGSLGKSSSVYQDVKGGLYEMSLLVTNYFYDTDFFPYTIGNLPFAFESASDASKIMKKFGEKYAVENLTDVIVMAPTATDPYDLFAVKPITSVEDLNGLKIRASGKSETELAKALDGVPVTLTTDDTYEGLQKKQVDATFYTPIGSVGMKFFEPAPYITKLSVSVTPMIPIMNKEFYEKLPDDLQKLFDEELNPALSELFTKSYETELEMSYEELEKAIKNRGEIITLSDEEMKRFKEAGKASWDAWIEDAEKRGYPGQQMVDDLLNMMEEEGMPTPF